MTFHIPTLEKVAGERAACRPHGNKTLGRVEKRGCRSTPGPCPHSQVMWGTFCYVEYNTLLLLTPHTSITVECGPVGSPGTPDLVVVVARPLNEFCEHWGKKNIFFNNMLNLSMHHTWKKKSQTVQVPSKQNLNYAGYRHTHTQASPSEFTLLCLNLFLSRLRSLKTAETQ